MNERIKELIKSCGIIPEDEHYEVAELIVKDFMDICKAEKDGYVDLRKGTMDFAEKNIYAEGEAASDRIRIIAKRRFGVK